MVVSSERYIATEVFIMDRISADRARDLVVEEYIAYLQRRRYAPRTVDLYGQCLEDFCGWRSRSRRRRHSPDERLVSAFLTDDGDRRGHRLVRPRRAPYEEHAALMGWLKMLRAEGTIPVRATAGDAAVEAEIAAYDRHLIEARGLQPATRIVRRRDVRAFLLGCGLRGSRSLYDLSAAEVSHFFADYTAGWKPGSIQSAAASVRSYLGFKAVSGIACIALAAALPRTAKWRLSGVPRALTPQEIAQLLESCDRATRTGLRDYAILRCLIDLGLRGAEVARMTLDEVDWSAGTFRIHGKALRVDVMPLTSAVAEAIVAYLRHGRPQTGRREIFVRHRPPYDIATTPAVVRQAVRDAAARAGLTARVSGPHVLRHTLATRLVQRGVPLKEIADLLRHRCVDTTTIYAKVDLPALAAVALPWPGSRL
jgi:integrase/recombinase XerD